MPALVARMLDDTVRIAEARAKLLDINLKHALDHALGVAIARVILAAIYLLGGACLLGALIVLLHGYMPWWQALALPGLVLVAASWSVGRIFLSRAARTAEEPERE